MPDGRLQGVHRLVGERLVRQGLAAEPLAGDALEAVRTLLAVQAQDLLGARLNLRARTSGVTAADVDAAISDERSLVVSWLCRGTLHLVTTDDLHWLHGLTTPGLRTGNRRRLAQEGVTPADAERAGRAIRRALTDGPLSRADLREIVRRSGVRADGQALVHLLFAGVLAGDIVRGPLRGNEQWWVLAADWLGAPLPPLAPDRRDGALRELALRYLTTRAPASPADLAKWSGLNLGDCRNGLRLLGERIRQRPDGLLELEPVAPMRRHPPRLLGPFDELLLGWADRTPVTGELTGLVTTNGLFRSFVLVDGRAVGTWRRARGQVIREPFEPLPPAVERALDAEAAAVSRFLAG